MSFLKKLKKIRIKSFLSKRNLIILLILLLFLGWGLVRGCSKSESVSKKFYLIGRDKGWYPLNLMGKERNLIAFTNDLMVAIAAETKLHFNWVETSPSVLVEGLEDENYDAILSTMRPTFYNHTQYVFSDLFLELGPVLIVPQDSTATSLKDMRGKTIGITPGAYQVFKDVRDGGANAYNIHLITYDNINTAIVLMEKDRLDGVIMHTIPAFIVTEGFNKSLLKVITQPLTDEGLRLIALKENGNSEVLIKEFNRALKKLKENGEYAKLIEKWSLIDPKTQFIKNN